APGAGADYLFGSLASVLLAPPLHRGFLGLGQRAAILLLADDPVLDSVEILGRREAGPPKASVLVLPDVVVAGLLLLLILGGGAEPLRSHVDQAGVRQRVDELALLCGREAVASIAERDGRESERVAGVRAGSVGRRGGLIGRRLEGGCIVRCESVLGHSIL